MLMQRPYQTEALEALYSHICEKESNPCIVIPTGGGKSALIAWAIQEWKEQCPWFRCIILAHRKELIEQNAVELKTLYPKGDIGIFSASLKRRDYDSSVLFASIDSVFRHAGKFTPWDVIMVDEAHRIPFSGEGKYRTFINESRKYNPKLRVIGWTATPFRMAGGQICHKDHILNKICYEAKVTNLIKDGYLCNLRSKVGETQPDLKGVKRNSGGDYIINSLAKVTGCENVVTSAIAEAVQILNVEQRNSIVFFCVDIKHCQRVSQELARHGIYTPAVTSKTKQYERDIIAKDFKSGKLRAVCNVNVYTEGFNAERIDCIVLLRPTLSAGLFSQMVGRGLRLHETKRNCLVLDFAGCIEEHGPIDLLGGQPIVMAACQECRESFSRAVKKCPQCGWEIPKQEMEKLEAKERERRMHGSKASKRSILSTEPETYAVDTVYASRHRKEDSPDSLLVQYRCGLSMFREWICLDHKGITGRLAQQWWMERFGFKKNKAFLMTVNEALNNLFLTQALKEWTQTITVKRNGKYWEVVGYNQPLIENESTS